MWEAASIRAMAQAAMVAVLAGIVVVSVLRLWQPFADWLEARDRFLVAPDWKFFAPGPNRSDYHILMRERAHRSTPSSWSTLLSSNRGRCWPRIVDPGRRLRKAVVDVSAHYLVLGKLRREDTADELRPSIATSMVYLLLLSAVSEAAVLDGEVQFTIVRTRDDPDDLGEIVMISDFHPSGS